MQWPFGAATCLLIAVAPCDVPLRSGSAQQGEKRRFYFTRVDTIEAQEAQQGGGRSSFRPDEDADGSSSYREVRRFKSTTMNGAYPSLG